MLRLRDPKALIRRGEDYLQAWRREISHAWEAVHLEIKGLYSTRR